MKARGVRGGGRARRRAARRGRDEKQRMLHAGRHRAPGHGRGAPGFRVGAPSRDLDLLLPCLAPWQLGSPQDPCPRRCPAPTAPGTQSASSGRHSHPGTALPSSRPHVRQEKAHGQGLRTSTKGIKARDSLSGHRTGTGVTLWTRQRGGWLHRATSCRFHRCFFFLRRSARRKLTHPQSHSHACRSKHGSKKETLG